MELARVIQEPQGVVVMSTIVELLNDLRQATSLVEVNVAAGIAHEAIRTLVG